MLGGGEKKYGYESGRNKEGRKKKTTATRFTTSSFEGVV